MTRYEKRPRWKKFHYVHNIQPLSHISDGMIHSTQVNCQKTIYCALSSLERIFHEIADTADAVFCYLHAHDYWACRLKIIV